MSENSESITHVPFILMGKLHQCFQYLASFSQNLINTNKVEINDPSLDIKQVNMAVKLVSKFFKKMTEHIEDSTVPKEISPFARSFFIEQSEKITPAAIPTTINKQDTTGKQPAAGNEGGRKRKSEGGDTQQKKRQETSDKSLAMGIFMSRRALRLPKPSPTRLN